MKNCRVIRFNKIGNKKEGYLTALEGNKEIPFDIRRVYYIYNVSQDIRRGYHTHKKLEQILICVNGSVKIDVREGKEKKMIELNSPNKGLYIGPGVWREMHGFNEESVLLILASDYYNEDDYIRDYDKFLKYKEYKLNKDIFIHEKAIVDSKNIGERTRIWGFSHILAGAEIGKNCNICEHVFIEDDVRLGNNVTVKCGVYIWDGIFVEDDVFIGPCVTFINDIHPRSKRYPEKFERTLIKKGSSLGANSTIMGGIIIGSYSTVGAGSVVLKNVKNYEVVVGNPAKPIGYNCQCGLKLKKENDIYKCKCGKSYKLIDNQLKPIF